MKKQFKAVELEQLDEATIHQIRLWRNSDFVRSKMYVQHEITEEEHTNYIEKVKQDRNRGLFVFYLDKHPFGVYQYEIHPEGNYVTNGCYLIDSSYSELGYGVILNYYICELAFYKLKVNKCFGEVIDLNKDAIHTNKRMGGKLEGILRQQVLKDGEYHDVYMFGILREEWEQRREKLWKVLDEIIEVNES